MYFMSKINFVTSQVLISFTLICLIKTVKAKQCRFYFDNGDVKTFICNIYEFCCGSSCCRSTAMTFYQMWYFWLMVFLTILFCSGGGWWYRVRTTDFTHTRGPQMLPPRVTVYSGAVQTQPYPPMNPNAIPMQNTVPFQNSFQYQYPPPPPYTGPPPSYETVVSQGTQAPPLRQG